MFQVVRAPGKFGNHWPKGSQTVSANEYVLV